MEKSKILTVTIEILAREYDFFSFGNKTRASAFYVGIVF